MSWSGIFKEAATVGKREITVKRSAFSDKDAAAIETWSDLSLFKVRGLNHLRISGFLNMVSVSSQIAQLNSLLELIIVGNGLTSLPEEIGLLSKLRVMDVSGNRLTALPNSFYTMPSLQTVLLNNNQFTVDSFPPCSTEPFPSIQYLDLTGNNLTALPQFVFMSSSLLELKASHNSIEVIAPEIGNLSSLKLIEMHKNTLHDIPSQLSQCSKLKFLLFEDNPISDPRLRKILTQFGATRPKAVLDYLSTKSKSKGGGGGKKKGKGKGKGKRAQESDSEGEERDDDATVVFSSSKTTLRIHRPTEFVVVKAMNNARHIRPYLVCCIVRDLDLEDDFGDNFRKFITLQVIKLCVNRLIKQLET